MLVLCRRVGETIHVGSEIVIQLSAIRIGRVRVGIRAPRHISIDRPETRAARHEAPRPEDAREHQTGMSLLVLSRRPGERILIGDDIEVSILGSHGAGVNFGITAPPNVVVDRGEVFRRKEAERLAAQRPLDAERAPGPRIRVRRRRMIAPA